MKRPILPCVLFASTAVLAACGDSQPGAVDGAPVDGGDAVAVIDAPPGDVDGTPGPDGGVPDGGVPDGGVPDGSLPDSAPPDAPLPDAPPPDAPPPIAMWQGASLIGGPSGSARVPLAGVDTSGRAIVLWRRDFRDAEDETVAWGQVAVNRYAPDTGWSGVQALSPDPSPENYVYNHDLAVGPGGDAMAMWQRYQNGDVDIMVRRYTPTGGWEPATVLYDGTPAARASGKDRVAVAADGSAIAMYSVRGGDSGLDDQLYARRYTPAGGWSAPVLVHAVALGDALAEDVAMDASGRAVAIWVLHMGGSTLWSSRFSPAGGWSAPVRLDTDTASQGEPGGAALAVDPAGNAVVAMQLQGDVSSVWGIVGDADGTWHAPVRLEDASRYANSARIAVDASGAATAVWQSWPADGPAMPRIRARRFTRAGGWTAIEAVPAPAGDASWPSVAMTGAGLTTVTWRQSGDGIWANQATGSGGWGTAVKLSSTTGGGYDEPVVAAGGGSAVVAWPHEAHPVDGHPTPFDLWANVFR